MKFSKEKMVARITKEGRADQLTDEILKILDDLDGQETISSNWRRVVRDEPVFLVIGRSGASMYVNENDCI